ncbi:MAG: hypothetical protein U1E84_15950 [Rhodoferax sp.]
MNWVNIALGFLFFCNLAFLLGAAYLLMRILDATEQGQIHLQKAASHVVEAGTHVKVLAKKAFHEMERNNDALGARESSAARSVDGLSFQIKTLVERVKQVMEQQRAQAHEVHPAHDAQPADDVQPPDSDAIRARLQEELQVALAKNHALQDEIDQTHYKLKDALHSNRELRDALADAKGIRQELVDSLMARSNDLQQQLEQARARALNAETLAATGAAQMEEIRTQIDRQTFSAAPPGVDQSELVADQQAQIDTMAARERDLLKKIDQLEGAFARNQAEKSFIEERFLQMDAGGSHYAPLRPTSE